MDAGYPRRAAVRRGLRYHAEPLAMAAGNSTTLALTTRAPEGSRAARRLRREGLVPGVIYGGEGGPEHFAVDGRILRNTLAHAGAILQVSIDDAGEAPVLVKDVQRHPVRGEAVHIDLLRVRMDQAVQTTVVLHLEGADEAPGVSEGGILSQELRELNVEALPGDLPEHIVHDVSGLEMNATLTLDAIAAPEGVTLLDDAETVVATITPPTLEPVEEEIETETEIVGDEAVDSAGAEAQAEGDTADEAAQKADAADES
jgi:large subunit ribosomal protein L25